MAQMVQLTLVDGRVAAVNPTRVAFVVPRGDVDIISGLVKVEKGEFRVVFAGNTFVDVRADTLEVVSNAINNGLVDTGEGC